MFTNPYEPPIKSDSKPVKKVVFIGDASSGKTQLLARKFSGTFDEEYHFTVGSINKLQFINVGNETIRVEVCDVSGVERFRSLYPKLYFANASIFVIAIPANVKDLNKEINFWHQIVLTNKSTDDNPEILFVLTKIDLIEETKRTDVIRAFQDAVFKTNTSKATSTLDDEFNAVVTSAKDNFNIEVLFKEIGKRLITSKKLEQRTKMSAEHESHDPITPYYMALEELWHNTEGTWFDKVRALLSNYLEKSWGFFGWRRHHGNMVQDIYRKTLSTASDLEIYEDLYNITRLVNFNLKGDFAMLFYVVKRYSGELDNNFRAQLHPMRAEDNITWQYIL